MFKIKQYDGAVIKGASFLEGGTIRGQEGRGLDLKAQAGEMGLPGRGDSLSKVTEM